MSGVKQAASDNRGARTFLAPLLAVFLVVTAGAALAQTPREAYEPRIGQEGKDVIWVPTPDAMVDKMLDIAQVTPRDFVMDLGSGDGRNVIGAAKRGARALGVEFNADLVELAKRKAEAAGVPGRALFVQGDMYAADISQATVLALFLLPDNLRRLRPKLLAMRPGSRIVSNTYEIPGWNADASQTVSRQSCTAFCIAYLYVVPAKVAGSWQMPDGVLTLEQEFQRVTGAYAIDDVSMPVENGRLDGTAIHFTINGVQYSGRVNGESMEGTEKGKHRATWRADRIQE